VALQWFVNDAASHQIRYEELAESVRNVFWLDQRLVYDGISSNVGWYGLLLATYTIAGFSIDTAKLVRVALHAITLICAAAVLRRAMRPGAAIVPLLVIGSSPALLYFNSQQTSFGVDVTYASLTLFLVASMKFAQPTRADVGKALAAGASAAIGAMSYPSFLLYLPSLALVWVWLGRRQASGAASRRWRAALAAGALAGALLPMAMAWAWLDNPQLLVHDPMTNAGLFRGGGGGMALEAGRLGASLLALAGDLFARGTSYYFELRAPDFAGVLGIAGAGAVLGMTAYLAATSRVDRTLAAAAALLLATSAVVPSVSVAGPPGLRRATGILAGFFVLFAIVWQYWAARAPRSTTRALAIGLCLIVPAGAALKLPSLVSDVRAPSRHRNLDWFDIRDTPDASLAALADGIRAGQPLECPLDQNGRLRPCRYQEIYSALAGWFRWTAGRETEIRAIDWKTGRSIVLTPSLWTTYYYPH
jgi:hypothetical protein